MKYYIARDKDGDLKMYHECPVRTKTFWQYSWSGYHKLSNSFHLLDDKKFDNVTWENSPVEVTIELKD